VAVDTASGDAGDRFAIDYRQVLERYGSRPPWKAWEIIRRTRSYAAGSFLKKVVRNVSGCQ
jgi:hypothetical protein